MTSATTALPSPGTTNNAATFAPVSDALYFHLYGLSRDDAGYVLDTFPHRTP